MITLSSRSIYVITSVVAIGQCVAYYMLYVKIYNSAGATLSERWDDVRSGYRARDQAVETVDATYDIDSMATGLELQTNYTWMSAKMENNTERRILYRAPDKSPPWRGVFNWTLTYRRDSDLFTPYGRPIHNPNQLMTPAQYSSIFKKKTKTAFWIVSHCWTASKREKYVKLLSQYIDVDTFGACGTHDVCSRYEDKRCLPELAAQYKFYLAFENTLCKDYVTEKYYKTLGLDTVTVVRGGADYKSLVPAGTYINTADFSSVKQLADYLSEIGSDEEKYTSFLKAKREYSGSTPIAYQRSFCEVCRRLRDVDEYRRSYTDIEDWWWNGTCQAVSDIV